MMLEAIEIIIKGSIKNILNCPKSLKTKWVYSMNKVYLKTGAEDISGTQLNSRLEYTLVAAGIMYSIISNGYKQFYVNNKYIKLNTAPKWIGVFLFPLCFLLINQVINKITIKILFNHLKKVKKSSIYYMNRNLLA